MILPDLNGFEDAEEYAAKIGAYHFSSGQGMNPNLFTFESPFAAKLRLIYELSYDLEQESAVLYETSSHTTIAKVKEWNDLLGYGKISFIDRKIVTTLPFTYTDLKGDLDDKIALGKEVKIYYHFDNLGAMVLDEVSL